MFTRVLDLAILGLVAVAILMPRPDVVVQPALKLPADRLVRVAELEAQLGAQPGEAEASLELANLFLDGHRPDWALATVQKAIEKTPTDHRLHTRRALALADHFEATPAFASVSEALKLCRAGSSQPCSDLDRSRIEILHNTLERVNGIDMRKDPNEARARIMQALRPTYMPPQKAPPAR